VAGNELWEYWNKAEFADKLGWFCTNYADICIDPPKPHTWEEVAVEMFEGVDHDVDAIDGVITSVLDYSKMCEQGAPNEQPEWETRAFLLGLADLDPLMVFGFHETCGNKLANRYWDKAIDANPTLILKSRPLVVIWLLASAKLDFPWASANKNEITDTVNELRQQEEMAMDRK